MPRRSPTLLELHLFQYPNQPTDCSAGGSTHETKPAPSDATTAEHECRLDRIDGIVDFYTDGVLQDSFSSNVPTEAGLWIWNIWSTGDPGYSVCPLSADAVLKISEIVMYYNTTSS